MIKNHSFILIIQIFLVIVSFNCYGTIQLTGEEASVLDRFFRILILKAEGGYVLKGEKPVCCEGFTKNRELYPDTLLHKNSVALREGARVWKKVSVEPSNIILKVANQDLLKNDFCEVLFLNKKLLLETIKKNEILFKYILGPKVNPESLVRSLLNPCQNLDTIFKEDKVLIGIVLGFGTHNSLYASRWEYLQDACMMNPDTPPLKRRVENLPPLSIDTDHYLFSNHQEISTVLIKPSLGFSSLEEECADLESEIEMFSPPLSNDPPFMFAYVKEDHETKNLLPKLVSTQNQIKDWCKSTTFLNEVLNMITDKQFSFNMPKCCYLPIGDISKAKLNQLIAKNIWSNLESYEEEYVTAFIEGFYSQQDEIDLSGPVFSYPDYKETLAKARKNVQEADKLFMELAQNMNCLIPRKLFYKNLVQSEGVILEDQSLVSLTYSILDPSNTCLSKVEVPTVIDLTKTIPGFALGLKGMREGETREIYIHPSLAYGVHTLMEKGIYLKAHVTLHKIDQNSMKNYNNADVIDLSFLFDSQFERNYSEKVKKIARFQGGRLSKHFAKSPLVEIEKIYNELVQMKDKKESKSHLSEEEYDVVNRIHWNIYFGQGDNECRCETASTL